MKNIAKMKALVLDRINLAEVMLEYGVRFLYDPRNAPEAQYHCPFHGKDNKPSARYYRDTKSCWCWVCHKRWDVVDFIRDKEELSYTSALLHIVRRYGLDISVIPDDPELDLKEKSKISEDSINLKVLRGKIKDLRTTLPVDKYGVLVGAWYVVAYKMFVGAEVAGMIDKLDSKIQGITHGG